MQSSATTWDLTERERAALARQADAARLPVDLLCALATADRPVSGGSKKPLGTRLAEILERVQQGNLPLVAEAVATEPVRPATDGADVALHSIELQNFLQFSAVNLAIGHDLQRPVVVIEGKNGYGKSSLLKAIRFALLGEDEKGTSLAHLVHDGAAPPKATVKVILRFASRRDGPFEVRRVRDYQRSGSKWAAQSTALTIQAGDETMQGNDATEWLDQRFPKDLLQYFVFDAESTAVQALSGQAGELLPDVRPPVEAALGIAPWRKIAAKLREWAKDKRATADDLLRQYGDEPDRQRRQAEERCTTLGRELAKLQANRGELYGRFEQLAQQVTAFADRIHDDDKALRGALTTAGDKASEQLRHIDADRRHAWQCALPLALISIAVADKRKATAAHSAEFKRGARHTAEAVAAAVASGAMPGITAIGLERRALAEQLLRLAGVAADDEEANRKRSEPNLAEFHQAAESARVALGRLATAGERRLWQAKRDDAEAELAQLGPALADDGSIALYGELRHEHAAVEAELVQVDARLAEQEFELADASAAAGALQRRADNDRHHVAKADTWRQRAETAEAAATALGKAAEDLLSDRIATLESEASWMLGRTAHKSSFRAFRIDRATFRYAVVDGAGKPVSSGFSTGERTLLALCLVHGIRAAAETTLPVVIEAPFKPLDRDHQDAVALHHFKDYKGQLLLLVKPDEIPKDIAALTGHRVAKQLVIQQRAAGVSEFTEIGGGNA